jgi:hypothetical protein
VIPTSPYYSCELRYKRKKYPSDDLWTLSKTHIEFADPDTTTDHFVLCLEHPGAVELLLYFRSELPQNKYNLLVLSYTLSLSLSLS